MDGFVYRWTNTVTGMMYVGSHNGMKDHYMGSGIRFRAAVKKYGRGAFTREVLYRGPDYRAEEERELKRVDAAHHPLYYNMKNESIGGRFEGSENGMKSRGHTAEAKAKISASQMGHRPYAQLYGSANPMFGKTEHVQAAVAKAKANTGKSYEEIHGVEAAAAIREKLRGPRGKQGWKIVTCPICGREGKGPNMKRYHFENCSKYDSSKTRRTT